MIYGTGKKPGKGTYECTRCKKTLRLKDDAHKLPPCSKCHNTTFTKVS